MVFTLSLHSSSPERTVVWLRAVNKEKKGGMADEGVESGGEEGGRG